MEMKKYKSVYVFCCIAKFCYVFLTLMCLGSYRI